MTKTKALIGHGNWEKWLADNCGNISKETAQRWMRLAKASHVTDLTDCKTMRHAYIACGILPELKPKLKAIGTAEVDIFDSFVNQVLKLADFDLSTLPQERKDQVREQLKAIEERL